MHSKVFSVDRWQDREYMSFFLIDNNLNSESEYINLYSDNYRDRLKIWNQSKNLTY